MSVLLATGIDIALPAFGAIERGLDDASSTSLVITTYVLGMALGQLIVGPVADRYGRRPVVMAGLVLYLIGAVASALAPSFGFLLLVRFAWGLGASAPAGLRMAVARDLYSGDDMARITTIVMAVFLVGPVIVPLVGEGLLSLSDWPIVFWAGAALAAVGMVWCLRFGETLAPEDRRAIDPSALVAGFRAVLRTRVTIGLLLANALLSGAFFIFLGSAQPVFERVYGRPDQFAWLFASAGLITIPLLLIANRMIERVGARRVAMTCASSAAVLSVTHAALLIVTGGLPSFWWWYAWVVATAASISISSPPSYAIALEPMGDQAGTASSLLSFASFAGGAGLAAVFDAQIVDSVRPFVIGFAIYTVGGMVLMRWALHGHSPVDPPGAAASTAA